MATPYFNVAITGSASGATQVRGVACNVEGYHLYNANASGAFLQFFDGPSGTAPVVGTTVPKWSVEMGPTGPALSPFMVTGIHFEGGLWIAATTTATGATGPTTAITVNLALAGS
jgi:hypothetical protein